jgi:hypothetical protein
MLLALLPTATMILPPGGLVLDGDHGGLVQDDALLAHVDQRVGGTEVDREIVGKESA